MHYPITLTIDHITYYCKEVLVENESYSKLVNSNGGVAVAYSVGYGSGWTTDMGDWENHNNRSNIKQMLFDSRLIQYITSSDFNYKFKSKDYYTLNESSKLLYHKFMNSVFTECDSNYFPNISSFCQLHVSFIPLDSKFKVEEYDGNETIKIFNPNDYIIA
jgi:hypothetical protein